MKGYRRKQFKRIVCVFYSIVLFAIIGLSCLACDPASFYYYYEELKESVVSVELIEYEGATAEMVFEKSAVDSFDFDKAETLETLEQSRIDDFCLAFSKIEFFGDEEFPNTPIGLCIKLTYANGNFLIVIGCKKGDKYYSGTHLYDKDGNIKEVIGWMPTIKDFYNLLNNFFGEVA